MDARRWVPDVLRDAGEDEDDDGYVVGVRESLDPESWSLMFMASNDTEDEQEISLGMDTYCLVVDPGQWTVYGGVVECELSDDRLILRLTERAAEKTAYAYRNELWPRSGFNQIGSPAAGVAEGAHLGPRERGPAPSSGLNLLAGVARPDHSDGIA